MPSAEAEGEAAYRWIAERAPEAAVNPKKSIWNHENTRNTRKRKGSRLCRHSPSGGVVPWAEPSSAFVGFGFFVVGIAGIRLNLDSRRHRLCRIALLVFDSQTQLAAGRVDVMSFLSAQSSDDLPPDESIEERFLNRFIRSLPGESFHLVIRNQINLCIEAIGQFGERFR